DGPEEGEAAAGEGNAPGGKRTKVWKLNYLDSEADLMLKDAIPQVVGGLEVIQKGDFTFYFDVNSRTLVATGKLDKLEKVDKLLSRLDVKTPQVHIEGKI